MTVKKYSYTDDFSVDELNAVLSANPERNRLIYEKIKQKNNSKRQDFLERMIGRIITDAISRGLKSINPKIPSNIYLSLSDSLHTDEQLKFVVEGKLPQSQISFSGIELDSPQKKFENKNYIDIKELGVVKSTPNSFLWYNVVDVRNGGIILENKPVIIFNGYEIKYYNYKKKADLDSGIEDPFNVSVEPGVTEDLKNGKISIHVLYELPEVSIDIEVDGFFKINEITDPDKISEYLVVNGTAILFPYVRSMISMLSSLDSDKAIILPTINTTNFLK